MSDEEEKEICSSCDKECGDDEYESTDNFGILCILCLDCLRAEFPTQVTIGQNYMDPKDKDISCTPLTVGINTFGIVAIHLPTGIAAFSSKHPTEMGNKKAALTLLHKIHADVERLESNERYGNIME